MGLCQTLVRQKWCLLRTGVDGGELEKVGVDGHSRVVSVMWVHYAKGSSELGTGSERHRE
jgi:hypothetical protein